MKNNKINLSKLCSISFILLLIFLSACKNKDNIEPQGFLSADVDGKDWFKKKSKLYKKTANLKPYGMINQITTLDNFFCSNREINIIFGVKSLNFALTEHISIYIPKAMLKEGNYKVYSSEIDSNNEDCSKKQISSLFSILGEDPPPVRYVLNENKENFLKILKIDKQNKFVEGQFQLNYVFFNKFIDSSGYEPNLDFKNGYFKIYYTIDL